MKIASVLTLGCVAASHGDALQHEIALDVERYDRATVTFQLRMSGEKISTLVDDFDGDGAPELLYGTLVDKVGAKSELTAFEFTNVGITSRWHQAFPSEARHLRRWHRDLDGDGVRDFALSHAESLGTRLEIWNFERETLLRVPIQPRSPADRPWDGDVAPGVVIDLNRDGTLDLVCMVNAGWTHEPREILAVHGATGRILWSLPVAHIVGHMTVLSTSRGPRIIAGGWGVDRAVTTGRLDSSHAWLLRLDTEGRILQADSLAGLSKKALLAHRTGQAPDTALIFVGIGGTAERPGTRHGIYRLDGEGAIDRFVPLPHQLREPIVIAQLDRDEGPELLALSEGEPLLTILQEDLSISGQYYFDQPVSAVFAVDLLGDDRDEIILATPDGRIFVHDAEMKPLAAQETMIESIGQLWWIDRGESGSRFLVAGPRGFLLATLGPAAARFPTAIVSLSALLLASLAAIVWRIRARRESSQTLEKARLTIALRTLTVFGHGEPGRVLSRASMLLSSASDERVGQERWCTAVREALESFQREIPPAIDAVWQSLASFPQEKLPWGEIQRLSSYVLADLWGLTRQLAEEERLDPARLRSASGGLRSLDEKLLGLRQAVRARFRCCVPGVVRDVVASMQDRPLFEGIRCTVEITGDESTLWARIDPDRLKREVIEELLTNAARAQRPSRGGWVAIRVGTDGDLITIEVADGGPGIDADLASRIFQRGVSTKSEGGGFGLYQARRMLEEFGGGITYSRGDPSGAVFRVAIPRAAPSAPAPAAES